MSKGIASPEPDPRKVYGDIIDLPRRPSLRHPPMPLSSRAAQFAPFAALTGFEDMITEEERIVDRRAELSDEEMDQLNQQLQSLSEELARGLHPPVSVTWFIPDSRKAGGRYETKAFRVRRLNPALGQLVLENPEDAQEPPLTLNFTDLFSLERI